MSEELREEIRINPKYAHFYYSEYPQSEKEESVPRINKKVLLTPDYLRRMAVNFGSATFSVLPPNCRYSEKLNQGHLMVIEEPPAFRTLQFQIGFQKEIERLKASGKFEEYGVPENFGLDGYGHYKAESLTLALPYVIFILHISDYNELVTGQIFFRVARLTGLADYLLKAPFPNISEAQYICFGSDAHGANSSLNAAVERAINVYWGAPFNTDYMYNYTAYGDVAGVHSYIEWQALSQSNPMFIYNVDWIKIPMNLGQAIDEVKRQYKLTSKTSMFYKNLADMFSQPLDSGKDEKPTSKSKRKFRLFYDVAEGIYLDRNYYIHVGDPFYIKRGKELCYINSFISFADSGDIKYIRVERTDGKLITYKYTNEFAKYLLEESKKLRFEETGVLKNGVVIKEDDIVIMRSSSGKELYKRVGAIRKSREGFHEARFGDGFYILENTEGILFDSSRPKYDGIELQRGKDYVYLTNLSNLPMQAASVVTFDKVDADGMGRLLINLDAKDPRVKSRPYQLRLDGTSTTQRLYPLENIKPLPNLFRCGRTLRISLSPSDIKEPTVFGCDKGIIYSSGYEMARPNPTQLKKYLLTDNTFSVKSFDLDIEFSIGDKVVVSDWENPVNMLSVKTIQGFVFNEAAGDISFALTDREGKLQQTQYVNGERGIIYVGRVRKITNTFGKLTAGTKIEAKESGIQYFPKKDVNIIIGFLTDTGGPDPLVLCSNCCTLWYSDVISKFTATSMKSKKWKSMQHAPIDVAKIKYQPGDIIQGTSDYKNYSGWLVFKARGAIGSKILDMKAYTQYPDFYSLDRYVTAKSKLDCIISPRISPKDQTAFGAVNAWPNLHGHCFTCDISQFQFINDERSMVNVQSSPK